LVDGDASIHGPATGVRAAEHNCCDRIYWRRREYIDPTSVTIVLKTLFRFLLFSLSHTHPLSVSLCVSLCVSFSSSVLASSLTCMPERKDDELQVPV
jgi:hypothetical protein